MKNFYFDICAIPIFVIILHTYFSRKMTRFPAFRMYFIMAVMSLACCVLDIAMEFVVNPVPLTKFEAVLGFFISFLYKLFRNASSVIYLIFILTITKTDYHIRSLKNRWLLWLPDTIILVLLIQNFFTGNVYTVTQEAGYARGPVLIVFYIVAMFYEIVGLIYCIYCKKFFDKRKWWAIISVYLLIGIAVLIQFVRPELMIEMFATAIGMLMVMILVMRPEESIDSNVGIPSWQAYREDLKNIILTKEEHDILVFHMTRANENRNYLGDRRYFKYMRIVIDSFQSYLDAHSINCSMYFEHPDNIYLIFDRNNYDLKEIAKNSVALTRKMLKKKDQEEFWFDAKICQIAYPADLSDYNDIINVCHRFSLYGPDSQQYFMGSDIIKSRDFEIQNHIEEILDRAIKGDNLQMYYQPIFDVKDGKFHSAEALARLIDKKYGVISPLTFITAAERTGMIIPLGNAIIEKVFRFISENDLNRLGISYIEINLSVAQCIQHELPNYIAEMQKKYNVDPSQVNFEITESLSESIGNIMDKNLSKLAEMGYSLSLDDYGTGYSNIQRLRKLPLSLIKIDKSVVDDVFTDEGKVIMKNTVNMMQGINKKLVMEGAETKEAVDLLSDLSCEYIQGFYFSKPLPENDFLEFIQKNNIAYTA